MLTLQEPRSGKNLPAQKAKPNPVKQYRKKESLFGDEAQNPGMLSGPKATVQPKFMYKGFDSLHVDFKLLKNTLLSIQNKYSKFFATDYCDVGIILDPTKDENPGDACSYVKKEGSEGYSYADLDYLRQGGKITKLYVNINIRKWFYDGYDTGKVLSMIAHEVGVHVLPYMDEYLSAFTPKIQKEIGFDGADHIDRTKTHGRAGINDHVRVADPRHEDFDTYRSFVNQMAEAVLSDNSQLMTQRELQMTAAQLTDAYLMDISTFTQSGSRLIYPLNAENVANRYNNYLTAKPKLAVTPSKKKGSEVRGAYNDLYKKALPVAAVHHPKKTTAFLILLAIGLFYFFRFLIRRFS